MDESKVLYYLDLWKQMMQHNVLDLDYPNHSVGFLSGGIHSVSDLEDSLDFDTAIRVDAAIDALIPAERAAIYTVFMGDKFTYQSVSLQNAYLSALDSLKIKLKQKNLID